ncbi:MAG: rod shape-determining protein MreC [Candidatus Zixiibacteriota bacterium]|jgi:rod shape-determining protein MreC
MKHIVRPRVLTAILLSAIAASLVALDLTGRVEARALLIQCNAPVYRISSYVKEMERGREAQTDMAERLARRSILVGQADRYRRENEALRVMLGYDVETPYEMTYAPVLERRAESWLDTVAVGVGRRDGVAVGTPVVGTEGLVGRVTRVTAGAAEVELVTSERVRVAVCHARSGATGVHYADAAGRGRVAYLPRGTDVKVGDLIVTAGTSRLYPPGLIVGYARTVSRPFDSMFVDIEVAAAEDMTALDNLFVLDWRPPEEAK